MCGKQVGVRGSAACRTGLGMGMRCALLQHWAAACSLQPAACCLQPAACCLQQHSAAACCLQVLDTKSYKQSNK
jgi:hypothetical protein